MVIRVAGHMFPTKRALTEHIRRILWTSAPGIPLCSEDEALLCAILEFHPHRTEKLGVGIRHLTTEIPARFPHQRCFWITRNDGSRIDFSYLECLRPSSPLQAVQDACRQAIVDQILATKERAFGMRERYRCPVSGTSCQWHEVHVDHQPPATFVRLVDEWIQGLGCAVAAIGVEAAPDGLGRQLAIPWYDQWRAYHYAHADLWVISIAAHIIVTRERLQKEKKRAMSLHTTTVLRMACALWSCDPAHGMTPAQMAWLTARLADPDWRPSARERAALQPVLLGWCARAHPQSLALIEQQFAQGVPNARS